MVKLVATLSSSGSRAVVVGGVADRYASELARAGQSNRRRAGTGSAAPERATRPPLWPAGMAEGNRATFGPRVGLSSHGSPAKGGPKSKCLARLKIARTSAGPSSLTISDLSRFAGPGDHQHTVERDRKHHRDNWNRDHAASGSRDLRSARGIDSPAALYRECHRPHHGPSLLTGCCPSPPFLDRYPP